MSYHTLYHNSLANPDHFWLEQAKSINWSRMPATAVSINAKGFYEWFKDGELNMSALCLDEHVNNGKGNVTAIIYDSPVSGVRETYSYSQLQDMVARFAGGLISEGIQKSDTVIIYMPMIPQAIVAMLACARIGAIHSVVFGGFAAHELAMRIDDCAPKAIITASYGIEVDKRITYTPLVNKAIQEASHKTDKVILYRRAQHNESQNELKHAIDFTALMSRSQPAAPIAVVSTHPLYILYTSGTTGKPKGVLRDTGGYATALKFSMRTIYNVEAGDVFFAASDLGWVVGHSYITYGPLLQGCTTVLYEGKPVKTPDAGAFWRLIEQYRIKAMFTAPTAIRAIKKEDPDGALMKKYDLSSLKALFLAGERCDPPTFNWISTLLNRPVIDHWWQTESGWPMLGIMTGVEQLQERAGSAGLPVCGYNIQILDEEGHQLGADTNGLIAVKLPLPPGCLTTLWNNDERFANGYLKQFPGYYTTGDGGYVDKDGYFYVLGRVDDVINVSGHRLSTGEMEEIIASHACVAECAVVGIYDELRGQVPLAFAVLKDGQTIREDELEKELVALIREKIGAVACLKHAVLVKRLPKTRSGKILRKTIRDIADSELKTIPSTIEDESVLDELKAHLKRRALGKAYTS